jgi:hypothetical protein
MRRHLAARLPADPAARLGLLVAAWALTRFFVLVVTMARESVYPSQENAFEMLPFEAWGPAFARGEGMVPLRDGPWEYPAAAAAVIAFPALLRGAPYATVFVQSMLLFDLAVLGLLAFWGLRRGSLGGAWFWVAAVPLLGPVVLGRFDLVPTLFAGGGLVAAAASAPITAGVLLGTGAAVKLWPALLVPIVLALHRGAWRVLAGGAAVGLLVVALVARFGRLEHLLSFLTYQQDRGLEIEAVPALPLMVRGLSNPDTTIGFGFGAFEVHGPGEQTYLRIADLGLVTVLLLVAWLTWRVRRRAAAGAVDPGLAAVVLAVALMTGFLLFDKVLSAQYPIWIAGLVAVGLCWRESPLRDTVVPMVGVLLLTQLVYPGLFKDLVERTDPLPVQLLAARDVLLVVVFVQATWAAWRLGGAAAPSEDEVPVDVQDRQQPEPAR